jgi:flagellar motor switch protein FliM
MSEEPLLKPEEVASVLSGGETEDPESIEQSRDPSSYSLREPVVIPPSSEPEARKRVEQIAASLQSSIVSVVDAEMTIDTEGFQQQRVASGLSTVPPPAWVLCFNVPGRGRFALVMPPVLALGVVEMALGGAGGMPEEGRGPTPLEQRVFRRLHASLVEPLRKETGLQVAAGALEFGEVPSSFANPGETVGIGLLRCTVGETDQPALLMVTAGLLVDEESETVTRSFEKIGPLLPRLGKVVLEARPVLRCGKIRMKDLLEMKKDAVILFDTKEGTPLRLSVAGQEIFAGQIGREDGVPLFAVTGRRGRAAGAPNDPS